MAIAMIRRIQPLQVLSLLIGSWQGAAGKAAAPGEDLKPILWMIGDWTAVEEGLTVRLNARLAPNGQAILFHLDFEKDGTVTPKYDGMYYWHPGKRQFMVTQVSSEGNVAQGTYTQQGATADQLVEVAARNGTFALKSHFEIEGSRFHFMGQFRPEGKQDWAPAVDVVYTRAQGEPRGND